MGFIDLISKAASVSARLIHDPGLLPEVLRKARSRITRKGHSTRLDEYEEQYIPYEEVLSRLLRLDIEGVRAAAGSERFLALLSELEANARAARLPSGAGFIELCYVIVRTVKPKVVLETGVANGFSSAVMLEALEENGSGELWSVDLPAFSPSAESLTGAAMPGRLRSSKRWHLGLGPDRKVLPQMLEDAGEIDFFHYDSDKSYEGMGHTFRLVWPRIRPGGVMAVDDVNSNDAFLEFVESVGVEPLITHKPTEGGIFGTGGKKYYVGCLKKPEA